jgi:hypothetical protein
MGDLDMGCCLGASSWGGCHCILLLEARLQFLFKAAVPACAKMARTNFSFSLFFVYIFFMLALPFL